MENSVLCQFGIIIVSLGTSVILSISFLELDESLRTSAGRSFNLRKGSAYAKPCRLTMRTYLSALQAYNILVRQS